MTEQEFASRLAAEVDSGAWDRLATRVSAEHIAQAWPNGIPMLKSGQPCAAGRKWLAVNCSYPAWWYGSKRYYQYLDFMTRVGAQ